MYPGMSLSLLLHWNLRSSMQHYNMSNRHKNNNFLKGEYDISTTVQAQSFANSSTKYFRGH